VFAAELARALGRIDAERVDAHREVVEGLYGLGADIPDVAPVSELMALMGRDKKAIGGLTFVLDGPNGVEPVAGVDPATVADLLGSLVRR
ncbi:MAG: 3-dehydroquinate synthase, partial [Ilumatobacteraceae bacterium]